MFSGKEKSLGMNGFVKSVSLVALTFITALLMVSSCTAAEGNLPAMSDLSQKLSCRMTKPVLEGIQQAEREGKGSSGLLLMKARALRYSGRYEEAAERYSDYLLQDPENLAASYERASCLVELRKTPEIAAAIASIAQKWPNSLELLLIRIEARSRLSESADKSELEKTIDKFRPATEAEYLLKAKWLWGEGRFGSAIDDYREVQRLSPRSVTAYLNEAAILSEQKKTRQSMEVLDRVDSIEKNCGISFLIRGVNQSTAGNLTEALASYDKSESLGVESGLLFEKRGNLHSKQFAFKEAIADYTAAISKTLDDSRLYRLYWMRAEAYLERQEQRKSYDDICKAVELAKDKCSYCYYLKGNTASHLGLRRDAIAAFEKFLQIAPERDPLRANAVAALASLSY